MGTRNKRPTSWVFFFLPAFGRYCAFGAARLRRAAPSARPPSQLDRPCAPPGVLLTTGSTLRLGLSTYSFAQLIWMIEPLFQSGNVGLTHFLMKHLDEVGTRKKRPTSWVFFFLPAFGRDCAFGALRLRRPPLPTGSPLLTARRPTHDWIDVAPIHV